MVSKQIGHVVSPMLPLEATKAQFYWHVRKLIQYFGFTIFMRHKLCVIIYFWHIIAYGIQCPKQASSLSFLPLSNQPITPQKFGNINKQINVIHHTKTHKGILALLFHNFSCPSLVKTWNKAIDNDQFMDILGISTAALTYHLQPSTATTKRKLHTTWQTLKYT